MTDTASKYFPYLAEVKKRLLLTGSIFIISTALGFFYYEKLITLALSMFRFEGVNIVFTSPFQFLDLSINTALTVGLVSTFPLLLWQLLTFIKPALTKKEFSIVLKMVPVAIVLFIAGFGFGILIMKTVIEMFYQKSQALSVGNILDVSKILSQVLLTSVLMGVAFEFPVVLTFLIQFKIITTKVMAKNRVFAWAISLVFAALLPPTDLLSLFLLTLPLVLLFEFTLILNKLVFRPKHKRR